MNNKLIILSLLAMMLVGTSLCETTKIPASQDVYISLGTESGLIVNQTDVLRCEVNVTDANGTKLSSYPGVPLIQFNISGINITDGDIGILVLKASSIERQYDDSALFALLSIGSEWNEESEYTAFLINILPAWNIIKKNDLTLMSINTDGDGTLAFDISEKLKEAKAKGDSISFLLEAISNSSYKADFFSRESGQGPFLIVMPYPSQITANPLPLLKNSSEPSFGRDKIIVPDRKAKTMADLQKIESANKNTTQNPIMSLKESIKQTPALPSVAKMELKT